MIKKEQVIRIISKALGVKVNEKSKTNNIEKWDSLGHLQILAALDNYTKGKSSKIEELSEAFSVKEIIRLLTK
jgi:acyl carrier protein